MQPTFNRHHGAKLSIEQIKSPLQVIFLLSVNKKTTMMYEN